MYADAKDMANIRKKTLHSFFPANRIEYWYSWLLSLGLSETRHKYSFDVPVRAALYSTTITCRWIIMCDILAQVTFESEFGVLHLVPFFFIYIYVRFGWLHFTSYLLHGVGVGAVIGLSRWQYNSKSVQKNKLTEKCVSRHVKTRQCLSTWGLSPIIKSCCPAVLPPWREETEVWSMYTISKPQLLLLPCRKK